MKDKILSKSYKNKYPFKLGTTSFIYPGEYDLNVKMLGSHLDEIELLMFESCWPHSLPSKQSINKLKSLGDEFKITYNVHLPTDVSLTDDNPNIRQSSSDILMKFIDQTSVLSPSTYTLHLPFDKRLHDKNNIKKWQDNTYNGIQVLLSLGPDSKMISVETLDYPFEWLKPVIENMNLSVCMDIGHLFLYGFDAQSIFNEFADKISIIHLHGVKNNRDHISLDNLSHDKAAIVMDILQKFNRVVSLEVFSYDNLAASLKFLEKIFK